MQASDKRKIEFDQRLEQSKTLLDNSRIVEAEKNTEKILEDFPDNAEALYVLAVCQRYLNRLEEALKTLKNLKQIRPGYGRAFQEEGHVCIKAGYISQAKSAYRHAVNLNNSLIASWAELTKILKSEGNDENAKITEHEYKKLKALPVELLSVRNMIAEGHNFQAERLCRRFLMQNKKMSKACDYLPVWASLLMFLMMPNFCWKKPWNMNPITILLEMITWKYCIEDRNTSTRLNKQKFLKIKIQITSNIKLPMQTKPSRWVITKKR